MSRWFSLIAAAVMSAPSGAQAQEPDFVKEVPNPTFVVEEGTTAAFRQQNAAMFLTARSKLLSEQFGLCAAISNGTAIGPSAEAFPYWEFMLKPGTYRMVLQGTDASWTNKMVVGTVSAYGQAQLDRTFGQIDNRGAQGPVVFSLDKPAIVRFEGWADKPGVGWNQSLCHRARNSNMMKFANEDGADEDYNDMIVVFEAVK
jgi:hypothetical protein